MENKDVLRWKRKAGGLRWLQVQPLWPTALVDSDGTWMGHGNTLLAKDSLLHMSSKPNSTLDLMCFAAVIK